MIKNVDEPYSRTLHDDEASRVDPRQSGIMLPDFHHVFDQTLDRLLFAILARGVREAITASVNVYPARSAWPRT
jgi:hypothetical protein